MKGNYIDLARYLDKVQRGCRVRLITFDQVRILIECVEKGMAFAAVEGGRIDPHNCYPGDTTVVLVVRNSKEEIVIGIQRCQAEKGHEGVPNYSPRLNRGEWRLVSKGQYSKHDIKNWADYWGPSQRFVLETTGMEV